ncbi:hypothetical protein L873DRAFT_313109 [Choiromyces venosus 120613-1]|uniref:Uncharacterized protein n=1 Tax=Choiromyces venosus 120613-1 TaxID=1336337 RepID=A0A3N4J4J8_9PEZI|nr:hypothetical protein L873DRAFT_313109 [Choiromyces venosus 120613-1]
MRTDPRIRQSLNRISTSLENASDNARTGCFTFAKSCLDPCLASLSNCLPQQRPHNAHHHRRGGRSEYPFGFYDYDDYSDEETSRRGGGFLAWGNDELDRLLAGSGDGGGGGSGNSSGYRGAGGGMYYGSSASTSAVGALGGKRKSNLPNESDPTVIPTTSMFGFLARFASFRGRGLRYKPSAANLQEHPQRNTGLAVVEEESARDRSISPGIRSGRGGTAGGRKRSATNSSGESAGESLRSRGDLWPSEDDDDAIPIGDDFLGNGTDDNPVIVRSRNEESPSPPLAPGDDALHLEEQAARDHEELEIERKREAARKLALQRGLAASPDPMSAPLPPSGSVSKTVSLRSAMTIDAPQSPASMRLSTPSPPPFPPPPGPVRREKVEGTNGPPPAKEFVTAGET